MSFLKKLGAVILNVAGVVSGIGPIASSMFPKYAGQIVQGIDFLNALAGIIVQVEVVGQTLSLPGTDKLKLAGPQVAQLLLQMDLIKTHKVKDTNLFKQGATKIADGMADVLNSLDDHGIEVSN